LIEYYFCTKAETNDAKTWIEDNLFQSILKPVIDYLFEHCLDVYIQCIVLAKVYLSKTHNAEYTKQLNDCISSILSMAQIPNLEKQPPKPQKPSTPNTQKTSRPRRYTDYLQWVIGMRSNDIFETIQPLLAAKAARK
jgi:hypothetical protein